MQANTLKIGKAVSAALLVAPNNPRESVRVSAFVADSGDKMVCNASLKPFSPIDGSQMQLLSSAKEVMTARQLTNDFVSVGHCKGCNSKLLATASMANAIDIASVDIHCPMCASTVTPSINGMQLIRALAADTEGDDDEDMDDEDDSEDMDDETAADDEDSDDDADEDSDDDADEDMDDEDSDDDSDDMDDDDSDDDSDDMDDDDDEDDEDSDDEDDDSDDDADDDADVDNSTDADDDDETAAIAAVRRAVLAAEGDTNESDIGQPHETDDMEVIDSQDPDDGFDEAVAQLRAEIAAMGDDDEDSEDEDDETAAVDDIVDGDEDDEDDEDEDGDPDDEIAAAVALFRPEVFLAMEDCDMPPAGSGRQRDDIDEMNDEARAGIRQRRGRRVDGNAHFKSNRALADLDDNSLSLDDNVEAEPLVGDDEVTPGTSMDVPDDSDVQDVTPGTEDDSDMSMAGVSIVDWRTQPVELVAAKSTPDVRWVHVAGKPVATLRRSRASAGVSRQWDTPVLESAFAAACARGMPVSDAREFGMRSIRYRVQGNEVVRAAMRRHADLATANVQAEVARGRARYQQSVRSALVAALKGSFDHLGNPVRDHLVSSLTRLSVAEPRSVVDTAFASGVDALLAGVFAEADVIAAKPDSARNEIANFVAKSSYQGRVSTVGGDLTRRLVSGQESAVAAAFSPTLSLPAPAREEAGTNYDKVRSALRSISRRI